MDALAGKALRNGRRTSINVGLRIRVFVLRRAERREIPAEVQFEIALNAVTDTTELGTTRLRAGPSQGWEEDVIAGL